MPQDQYANRPKEEAVLKDLDTDESGRGLHKFTSEHMGDEEAAVRNVDKDPAGPIKARARTRAIVQTRGVLGGLGDIYKDPSPRKNNPNNAFVKKP
jgi:hypothetical protein